MYKSMKRRMEQKKEDLRRKCKHETTILRRIEDDPRKTNVYSEKCSICGKDLGIRYFNRPGRRWKE